MPLLFLGLLLNLMAIGMAALWGSLAAAVMMFVGALAALWGTEIAHPSSQVK